MVVLAILIVIGFIVDVVLFILATGKFARLETHVGALESDQQNLDKLQQKMQKGFADLQEEFLKTRGLVVDLQEDFNEVKTSVELDGDNIETLLQDLSALQLVAANGKESATMVSETPKNRGGRPPKQKVG